MAGSWGDINASQTIGANQALRRNAGDNGWEAFSPTGGAFSGGVSNIGNTVGSTGSVSNGIVFAGGNNVTLSQSTGAGGATVTISAGAGGGGYNSAQFTNSTANSTMNIVWAGNSNGSGNITFGLTGSTVTASAPAATSNSTYATMWYPYNEGVNVAGQAGQASLGFTPVPTPSIGEELQVDRVVYPLYFSNSSNSTGSLTASFWMGLYTRNNDSISLAHSQSTTVSLGWAGNNSSAQQRGVRLLTFGWSTTIPDGRYVVGMVSRSTTAGGNATLSQMLVSQINSNVSGHWDTPNNASVQWPLGLGYYSATTAGLPASVAYSQIRGTNSLAARPPSWHMINGSA